MSTDLRSGGEPAASGNAGPAKGALYRILLERFETFARRQPLLRHVEGLPPFVEKRLVRRGHRCRTAVPSGAPADRSEPLDRLTREAQIEALDEPRDAVRIHLESVAGAEVSQGLRFGPGDAPEVDEFAEEPFEAGGGDNL